MTLGHVDITDQLVQAVRDAVDIVDIAGEHTRLRKAGRRQSGLCPLHKEKTASFSVDPVQGLFYCFGCGQGGDAIKLHMLVSGDDFPAAIEALARRYGIPLPTRRSGGPGGRRQPDLSSALETACRYFRHQLGRVDKPRLYLEKRRIEPEVVEKFELGYAPEGWQNLLDALRSKVPLADLEAAGLVARSQRDPSRHYDRFRDRLMFPIRTPAGRLVGFGGRTLGDDRAKYLNTSETAEFRKGHLLYGLQIAKRPIREGGRACLTEGYFDVIGAYAAGIDWAVATMGTALTPEQAALVARYADEVVVAYDGDKAGEAAHRRALPLLLAKGLGVRRAELGEGHDPDSLRFEQGAEAVVEAVDEATDSVAREIDRLTPGRVRSDPQAQARAARAVAELLRPIRDGVLRYSYGRQAADRLDVPVELLWRRSASGRPGTEEPPPEVEPPRRPAGVVRSVEELTLELLLSTEANALPPPEDLPPPEAFLDPACRNIYSVYCDLYRDRPDAPPGAREVLDRLAADGDEVDRVARLLLEGPFDFRADELEGALGKLIRRWRQQRSRELSREIAEAQRAGDHERSEELLREKTDLIQTLHRGSTTKSEGGGH